MHNVIKLNYEIGLFCKLLHLPSKLHEIIIIIIKWKLIKLSHDYNPKLTISIYISLSIYNINKCYIFKNIKLIKIKIYQKFNYILKYNNLIIYLNICQSWAQLRPY